MKDFRGHQKPRVHRVDIGAPGASCTRDGAKKAEISPIVIDILFIGCHELFSDTFVSQILKLYFIGFSKKLRASFKESCHSMVDFLFFYHEKPQVKMDSKNILTEIFEQA